MGARRSTSTLLLVLAAFAVAACNGRIAGISVAEEFEGTELFKKVELSGERRPGSDLTVTLVITNGYPIPVRIACYYEDTGDLTDDEEKQAFHERATKVGETVLPAQRGRRPDDEDLPRETLTFSFKAPAAGEYFLACLTPAASDNGLGLKFRVRN